MFIIILIILIIVLIMVILIILIMVINLLNLDLLNLMLHHVIMLIQFINQVVMHKKMLDQYLLILKNHQVNLIF